MAGLKRLKLLLLYTLPLVCLCLLFGCKTSHLDLDESDHQYAHAYELQRVEEPNIAHYQQLRMFPGEEEYHLILYQDGTAQLYGDRIGSFKFDGLGVEGESIDGQWKQRDHYTVDVIWENRDKLPDYCYRYKLYTRVFHGEKVFGFWPIPKL